MDLLRYGSKGPQVGAWQQLLRAKGFVLVVDREFGPKTLHATKVAQSWAGVTADGIVGPLSWRAVREKTRTRRPRSAARNILQPLVPFLAPKIIDCRHGQHGYPQHATRQWETRIATLIVCKLGHYTGGPASFVADANFHVHSDYLTRGGAPAIAYALGVDKDGTLLVFNDWRSVTWHCDGGHNTDTLGVVWRGGSEGPNLAQKNTLRWLWAQLDAATFKPFGEQWPRLTVATTHRHVNSTTCPGERGERFYRSISKKFAERL